MGAKRKEDANKNNECVEIKTEARNNNKLQTHKAEMMQEKSRDLVSIA